MRRCGPTGVPTVHTDVVTRPAVAATSISPELTTAGTTVADAGPAWGARQPRRASSPRHRSRRCPGRRRDPRRWCRRRNIRPSCRDDACPGTDATNHAEVGAHTPTAGTPPSQHRRDPYAVVRHRPATVGHPSLSAAVGDVSPSVSSCGAEQNVPSATEDGSGPPPGRGGHAKTLHGATPIDPAAHGGHPVAEALRDAGACPRGYEARRATCGLIDVVNSRLTRTSRQPTVDA